MHLRKDALSFPRRRPLRADTLRSMAAHPSVDQRRLRAWILDCVPEVIPTDGEAVMFNVSGIRFVASVIKGGYITVGANIALPNELHSTIDPLEIIADVSVNFPSPKMSVEFVSGQSLLMCRAVNYIEAGCNDAQGIAMVQTMVSAVLDAFQAYVDRWNEVMGVQK